MEPFGPRVKQSQDLLQDEQIKMRIEHSIDDLISKKFIHYKFEKNNRIPVLTDIGELLISYIS